MHNMSDPVLREKKNVSSAELAKTVVKVKTIDNIILFLYTSSNIDMHLYQVS